MARSMMSYLPKAITNVLNSLKKLPPVEECKNIWSNIDSLQTSVEQLGKKLQQLVNEAKKKEVDRIKLAKAWFEVRYVCVYIRAQNGLLIQKLSDVRMQWYSNRIEDKTLNHFVCEAVRLQTESLKQLINALDSTVHMILTEQASQSTTNTCMVEQIYLSICEEKVGAANAYGYWYEFWFGGPLCYQRMKTLMYTMDDCLDMHVFCQAMEIFEGRCGSCFVRQTAMEWLKKYTGGSRLSQIEEFYATLVGKLCGGRSRAELQEMLSNSLVRATEKIRQNYNK